MKTKLTSLIFAVTLLFSTSCLKQGQAPNIKGIDGPKVNVLNGKLLVSIGLENINLPVGVSLPINGKLKGSTVTIGPRLEGGTLLQAALDISAVNTDFFEIVPANLLPNGEPFPFTMSGEIKAHAFYVEKALKSTFYASKEFFGVFVPVKFPSEMTFNVNYQLKIGGKDIGQVMAVGNNAAGEGSGLVLVLDLNKIKGNKDMQTALKYSKKKKYRNRVF